jgi:hypothetical protein
MLDPVRNAVYMDLLLDPLRACAQYKPKFGTDDGDGISLEQFQDLYGQDPFYHWVGIDSDLMYAAHKAAGGMTSIYRQLGAGWERLFRAILQDELNFSTEDVAWTYKVQKDDGKMATLTLDGRIDVGHLSDDDAAQRVEDWLGNCGRFLDMPVDRVAQLRGAVFEARQGYKSADAKRQNADLRFGLNASAENYLPVVAISSTQASRPVIRRYRNAKMLVLTGILSDDETVCTYAFFRKVVGFDLEAFFKANTTKMRERCIKILEALLTPK